MPELRFSDGEGQPLSLADFRGKIVLLNIWATWCVPCRKRCRRSTGYSLPWAEPDSRSSPCQGVPIVPVRAVSKVAGGIKK
jgi:thiol-disulfide isomerase/thioredoxin